MIYTIYFYGCETCGIKAFWLNKFRKWCKANNHKYVLINTKYEYEQHETHLRYLPENKRDSYETIAVDSNNKVIYIEDQDQWN